METRKNKMAAKYVEFDRKPNFIPKFPKIGLVRWGGLSEPTHSQCGPLQRAIVAKWLRQRSKRDFISCFSCKTRKAILFPVFYFFDFISCKFENLIFKEPTKISRHGLPILLCCLARISVHRLRYTGLCTPHITTIHSHPMQIRAVYSGRCFPTVKLKRTWVILLQKMSYLCSDGLGPYFHDKLVYEMGNSGYYTLSFDETTNANTNLFPVKIRVFFL